MIGLAIVALASPVGLATARAGTYVMRNCDVPGYPDSLLGPWEMPGDVYPTMDAVDACATGGGVRLTVASQMPGGGGIGILLRPPANGPQSQVRILKFVLWYAARLTGTGQPMRFVSEQQFRDGTYEFGAVSSSPPGSENVVVEQVLRPDFTSYILSLGCGPGGVVSPEPCVPSNSVPVQMRGMEVSLSEDIPPFVSQPAGALLDSGPQSGVRALEYVASDPQSGLSRIDALLDDVVVATQDLSARCGVSDFTVCPGSDNGTLQVDTRAVSNGVHALTLRARDAAGNERTVKAANPVQISNLPNPGADPAYTLTARFNASSRSTLTVPYGARVSVRGRVTRGPLAGPLTAQVGVLERTARHGARETATGSAQTKADGSFSYVLSARRPSRTLRLTYRPLGGMPVYSAPLKLRVRAASSLRASLRGVDMRYRGRVQGGPIPKGGKVVRMEGRAPGAGWKAFASLRTDRHGRFAGHYRLRVRRPGVVLKVRAVLPRQPNYPYASSRSRAVSLHVR